MMKDLEWAKKLFPLFVRNIFRSGINGLIFSIRRNGYLKTLRQLLPVWFRNILSSIISIPLTLLTLLFSPIIKIRFVRLLSEGLGYFALNTEIMLCAFDADIFKKQNSNRIKYIYYTHSVIVNKQLYKMWKRILPIFPFPTIASQVNNMLSFFSVRYKDDFIKKTVEVGNWSEDKMNLMNHSTKIHAIFTSKEKKYAEFLMKKLGIPVNAKYICLVIRDSLYLEKLFPENKWSYHDHRDANVMNYEKAALFLAEKGYYVIRMGKWVKNRFQVSRPNIVDYANHELRCDLLDIYIPSQCHFFISTSTGMDAIPQIFRKPILFTNVSIPGELQIYSSLGLLFIPKKIKNKKTGNLLRFSEIQNFTSISEYKVPEFFLKRNLELIENTSDEIFEVVQEMENYLISGSTYPEYDKQLQKVFLKKYCSFREKNVDKISIKIGSHFLQKYRFLLEPCDSHLMATADDTR